MHILSVAALAALFYILGKTADAVVVNMKRIGFALGVPLYFLGIMLGFLTSAPEFSIGIASIVADIEAVSFGNLFGGTVVLFGLVLGLSAVANRAITTGTAAEPLFAVVPYCILPLFLGLDGRFGVIDGLILMATGTLLLVYLYVAGDRGRVPPESVPSVTTVMKSFFKILIGVAVLMLAASGIVRIAASLLEAAGVPLFLIGLLAFSLGTNLPEITIAFRSWRNGSSELSYTNLFGSAAANSFLIGMFAVLEPVAVPLNASYAVLAFFLTALSVLAYRFSKSCRKLERREGLALLALYVLFVVMQVALGGALS